MNAGFKRRRAVSALLRLAFLGVFCMTAGTVWLRLRDGQGDLLDRAAQALQIKPEVPPRFQWKSVDRKHWQVLSETGAVLAAAEEESSSGSCKPGMALVDGKLKLDSQGTQVSDEVESLQNRACTQWISRDFPARCGEFSRDAWLQLSEKLPSKQLRYCIDQYEYPNVKGENPIIVVTFTEASTMCKSSGKRLCTESEWTLACEGEEATPYPTGYVRDTAQDACVIDQPWHAFSEGAFSRRDSDDARDELDRLWQGKPSGSRPRCVSAFGVYDMTGNVDEWTRTVRSEGYASVLKGGYWGPVRARCRPATRAHNETFVAYQQGFRCCTDASESAPAITRSEDAGGSEPDAPSPLIADAGPENETSPQAAEPLPNAPTAKGITDLSLPKTPEKWLQLTWGDSGGFTPELRADDEVETLGKRRKSIGCSLSQAESPGGALWMLAPLAVLAKARRRRRARGD
jgi:formylglycine-generating enzyme